MNKEINNFTVICRKCGSLKFLVIYYFEDRRVEWKCKDCVNSQTLDYPLEETEKVVEKKSKRKENKSSIISKISKKYHTKSKEVESYINSLKA